MGNGRPWALRPAVIAVVLLAAGACAGRTPPPLPAALTYPEFVFPSVPTQLGITPGVERIDGGWRFLQNGDLVSAEREFSRALSRSPALYPAMTGAGYVALARRDYTRALARFDAVARTAPQYAPALVGRGQALLAAGRGDDALAAFEAALVADASLPEVARRVEVLRLRTLQDVIAAARAAAAAGRASEARLAYTRAVDASPGSAFLYRELGALERASGDAALALAHFRRAVDLDPADAESLEHVGDLLDAQRDFAGAETAYQRAAAIAPTPALSLKTAAVAERARDARLPAEFRAIPTASRVTRGDLAALIGVRLEPLLRTAPERQVVVTDAGGHWAAPWIGQVARIDIVEAFENHTFQPGAPVRRADLAAAVSRVVTLLAQTQPELRATLAGRPRIADMPATHLSYPAVAAAVSSGVMPLMESGQFQGNRLISGAEAVETVDRLRALTASAR